MTCPSIDELHVLMAKKKYYVVWQGTEPGVYDNWPDAQLRVKGFAGARFKSFGSLDEARMAFKDGPPQTGSPGTSSERKSAGRTSQNASRLPAEVRLPAWSVDAACSGVPGPMEYRAVDLSSGKALFHQGPYPDGTNNIGEFLALVHALALLRKAGDATTMVYTDSRTALAWLRQGQAKTTLKRSAANQPLFQLLYRAEQWLKENKGPYPVRKWETDKWGEIPADFGRK